MVLFSLYFDRKINDKTSIAPTSQLLPYNWYLLKYWIICYLSTASQLEYLLGSFCFNTELERKLQTFLLWHFFWYFLPIYLFWLLALLSHTYVRYICFDCVFWYFCFSDICFHWGVLVFLLVWYFSADLIFWFWIICLYMLESMWLIKFMFRSTSNSSHERTFSTCI